MDRVPPMHPDQLTLPHDTVRALVDEQFPAWAHLPLAAVPTEGTVNAIFRIGGRLAARFPLRPGAVDTVGQLLRAEAEAAREFAAHTRFPAPEPVALGRPGAGYPLPWAVQTWLDGTTATHDDPGGSAAFARDLAELITDVRAIDTRGRTFSGPGRGGDLRGQDAWMETCFRRSVRVLDVPRLRALWRRLRRLPRTAPDAMTHGDLMPGNVLVARGGGGRQSTAANVGEGGAQPVREPPVGCRRLAGVLDTGGLAAADPALDLTSAWHLLEPGPRRVLREALGCDDLEWARGRAWAFAQAVAGVWYYVDSNPVMSRTCRRTLDRILADEDGATAEGPS